MDEKPLGKHEHLQTAYHHQLSCVTVQWCARQFLAISLVQNSQELFERQKKTFSGEAPPRAEKKGQNDS